MKGITSLTIDTDLLEIARIKRMEDGSFSLSNTINEFLRSYFGEDIKDIDSRKLKAERLELERKLALLKSQEKAIDTEKVRQEQEHEKKYGKVIEFDEYGEIRE